MIIPIGHDDSWTKRRPVATWGIALICLAAWIGTLVAVADMRPIPQVRFQEEARTFWERHPYLEIEGRLARYMILREDPDALSDEAEFTQKQWDLWVANKRLRAAAAHRAQQAAGDTPEDLSNLQAELDALVGLGFYADPEQLPLDGEHPAWTWGLIPAKSTAYTYVTHVFMHGSWGHLLGNLFLFLIAAPALEDRWGRALFFGFFVTAGVAAGGFHALMELGSEVPLVGASGAISAVLGAFLVLNFSTRIKFFWLFFPPFYGTFRSPAWICLPFWFLNEVSSAFMSQANLIQDNVAYWAHVGGFLSGSFLAVTVKGFRLEERFLNEAIRRKMAKAGRADQLERARGLIEGNLLTDAQVVLEQAIEDHPNDPETLRVFLEFAQASGRVQDAEPHVEAWLKSNLGDKPGRSTLDTWCQLTGIEPAIAIAPATLFKVATALAPRGRREEAAHALRLALSDIQEAMPGSMLRRIAELAPRLPDAGDVERRALERLCEDPQLPDARREAVRSRLDSLDAETFDDPFADRLERAAAVVSATDPASRLTTPIEIDFEDEPTPGPEPAPAIAATPSPPEPLSIERAPFALDPAPTPRATEPPALALGSEGSGLELGSPEDMLRVLDAACPDESGEGLALDDPDAPDAPDAARDERDGMSIGVALDDQATIAFGDAGADFDAWLDDADVPLARFSDVKVVDAVPISLEDEALRLRVGPERTSRLALSRVDGLAVAVLDGLSERPVAVIDLLLNGRDTEADVLQLVRMRSDRFDPHALAPGHAQPMAAFGAIVLRLLEASGGDPRFDPETVRAGRIERHGSLEAYERTALDVERIG